jgi:hypothetical protein
VCVSIAHTVEVLSVALAIRYRIALKKDPF